MNAVAIDWRCRGVEIPVQMNHIRYKSFYAKTAASDVAASGAPCTSNPDRTRPDFQWPQIFSEDLIDARFFRMAVHCNGESDHGRSPTCTATRGILSISTSEGDRKPSMRRDPIKFNMFRPFFTDGTPLQATHLPSRCKQHEGSARLQRTGAQKNISYMPKVLLTRYPASSLPLLLLLHPCSAEPFASDQAICIARSGPAKWRPCFRSPDRPSKSCKPSERKNC